MKLSDLAQKNWFSWSLILALLLANVILYNITGAYFKYNNVTSEEISVSPNYLGSGSKVIDWAQDILRFFKNP
ncbi:MAG: hypothetical protein HQ463_07425 [Bacteroidetes bacterium]|nr:hypothetical protein [Bacteroidota bacterium]